MTNEYTPIEPGLFAAENLVYVRRIAAEEVREILPANALEDLSEMDDVFALHSDDGTRVAIVEGREAAFAAARMHELNPVSVH